MGLDTNLVNYYNLNETSGAIIDSVGGSNMTNSGGLQNQTGILGKAIRWDGWNKDSFGTFKSVTTSQTLNVWVYYNTSKQYSNVLALTRNGGADDIEWNYRKWGDADNTTKPGFYINSVEVRAPSDITESAWHMLTYTWSGSNDTNGMKLYIDGTKVAEGTANVTSITQQDITWGYSSLLGNDNSDLIIDEIGYWSRALSDSEITTLYNGGTGLTYPFPSTSNANMLIMFY